MLQNKCAGKAGWHPIYAVKECPETMWLRAKEAAAGKTAPQQLLVAFQGLMLLLSNNFVLPIIISK